MADKYVNESGNDSNTGADVNNAYLTRQKGFDEVGDGDTLYLGYSETAEAVIIGTSKSITVIADIGHVWPGVGESCISPQTLASKKVSIQNVEFKDGRISEDYRNPPNLENCIIDVTATTQRLRYEDLHYDYTIITGKELIKLSLAIDFYATNCLYLGNINIDGNELFNSYAHNCYFTNVIFLGDFAVIRTNYIDWVCENCCFENDIIIDGTTYSLSEAEALYPTKFVNCFDNPAYLDDNYCPKPGSPLIGNGKGGLYETFVGARRPANNYNAVSDYFVGATFSNVEYSTAYGGFVLSTPGTGTITSNVLNYGAAQNIRNIYLEVTQSWPTDVVDYDNTNVPNTLTFRYRTSNTSEADCLAQSWTEAESWEDLNIDKQYWQFEITLRDDGVAA